MIDAAMEAALRGSQLPVINRPLDNTALQAYLACPREYFLAMIQHMRSSGRSPALVFGSAWHKALETHYKSGGDRDLVQLATQLSWEGHDSADDYRTLKRVLLDYDKYSKKFLQDDIASTVGWPDHPIIEVSTNAMGSSLLHPWAGKIDRIVEVGGLLYVEDHKTTSRLDKNYFTQFKLSYQMKGYTYLAQQLLPGEKIVGVRINLSHVLTAKTEFHRQLFTFSKGEIDEWTKVTNAWMSRLGRDIETYNEAIARGLDSWDAINLAFPAHFGDNGCSRKFGMCQYHQACSVGTRIRDQMLERDFEIRPWNPLEADDDTAL